MMQEITTTDSKPILSEFGSDRDSILRFEKALSSQPGAVVGDNDGCPLKHSFAPGVYVREIFIPKGTVLTGKIHRHEHPNFLMKGEVIVVTEFGGREHLKAPMSMISKAGTKRAVYAIEDTVWITVHLTNETDLKKIEDEIIAPTYDALIGPSTEMKQIASEVESKNCLVLALKELGRDYRPILSLEADEYMLPFKMALETLKHNNVSLDELSATQQENGVWHVVVDKEKSLSFFDVNYSDLVGTWVAAAVVGGGALAAGGALGAAAIGSGAAGDAAQAQLTGTRESIAAQERLANKAFDIFKGQAAIGRGDFQRQFDLAMKELQPLRDLGLANLQKASGFTDPNSPEAQAERAAFQRTLAQNLSARGLTGSGAEIAGLSDFELGLARERRNLTLGLAGQGANTLQQIGGLRFNLGQGLAGLSQGLGQGALGLFGNLGQNVGGTIQQGAANIGNLQIAQGQAMAQGLLGAGNAFQSTIQGLGQLNMFNQQQQQQNSLLNRIFPTGGSGGMNSGGFNLGFGGNFGFGSPNG